MTEKKKILIADDDHEFVDMLRIRLESSGYETVCAHEGIRAVEVAQQEIPDIIILDWKMPVGKGDEVIELLSEKDSTKNIPVLLLTGVNEDGMSKTAFHAGVKAIIRKPYEPQVLLQKIREILQKG